MTKHKKRGGMKSSMAGGKVKTPFTHRMEHRGGGKKR